MTINLPAASQGGTLFPAGPAGATGTQGAQGPQGAQGAQGTTGATGSAGPAPFSSPIPWTSGLNCVVGPPATAVFYGGSLYVCTTPHVSGGSFTSAYWQQWQLGGVTYLNTLAGNLSLSAPGGEVVTSSGRTITIASPGGHRNKFRNGAMDVWQRGTSISVSSGTPAYTADGWIVSPTGASVTASQVAGRSGGLTLYSLKIAGASGVTALTLAQRIESYIWQSLSQGVPVTVQFYLYNGTSSSITPQISSAYPTAKDNYASTTSDLSATSLQACGAGVWTQCSYAFTPSTSSAGLGEQITIALGALTTGYVLIAELDMRLTPGVSTGVNGNPPPPELRPIQDELPFCQRYYFNSANIPGATTGNIQASNYVGSSGTGKIMANEQFFVSMRAAPSITLANQTYTNSSALSAATINSLGFFPTLTATASGSVSVTFDYAASAEL